MRKTPRLTKRQKKMLNRASTNGDAGCERGEAMLRHGGMVQVEELLSLMQAQPGVRSEMDRFHGSMRRLVDAEAEAADGRIDWHMVWRLVTDVHECLDLFTASLLSNGGPRPPCREGCRWCCGITVDDACGEAPLVALHLRRVMDPAAFAAMAETVTASAAEVGKMGTAERMSVWLPCPLLSGSGLCTIYPIRPLACRAYISLDEGRCRAGHEDPSGGRTVPLVGIVTAVALGLCEGLRDGLRAHHVDPGHHDDFVLALAESLQVAAAGLNPVEVWLEAHRDDSYDRGRRARHPFLPQSHMSDRHGP